jgi:tetratricopeptide (TPR) repeat protein
VKIFAASLGLMIAAMSPSALAQDAFTRGTQAYQARDYDRAAAIYGEAAKTAPAAGLLQNLGLAEWRNGQAGPAILAWEQAQWLAPMDATVRDDLRFARKNRLLSAPELAWYEICSTWLPASAWAWLACGTFWLAVSLILLPWVFRWRKAAWHQALAAAGFALFLLTLPALLGIQTRSKLGVILGRDTPLRLTPTAEAQTIGRLPDGETVRFERARGDYLFIRTNNGSGWVKREQLGLIARATVMAANVK